MLIITIASCISMSMETPHKRLMNTPELKVCVKVPEVIITEHILIYVYIWLLSTF